MAEFVGTLALIYVGILVLVVAGGEKHLVEVALAHGLTIAVMVSATMTISGGQLNPAVTFGLLVAGKIPSAQAAVNVVAQIAGGVLGALLASASVGAVGITGGIPAIASGVSTGQGILVEAMLTFFLVFVVFGTGVDPRFNGRIGGLAIGFTVALDILAGGPLTGASMNTARWLGPALVDGALTGTGTVAAVVVDWSRNSVVHLVGPLLGGAVAGVVWKVALFEEPRSRA